MPDARYLVEIHLATGAVVSSPITEEEADEIASRPRFVWPPDDDADARRLGALFTIAADSRDNGKWLETVDDRGRLSGIPGAAIVAFNVLDRQAVEAPRRPGFSVRESS